MEEFQKLNAEAQATRDPKATAEAFALLRVIAYAALVYEDHPAWHHSWRP